MDLKFVEMNAVDVNDHCLKRIRQEQRSIVASDDKLIAEHGPKPPTALEKFFRRLLRIGDRKPLTRRELLEASKDNMSMGAQLFFDYHHERFQKRLDHLSEISVRCVFATNGWVRLDAADLGVLQLSRTPTEEDRAEEEMDDLLGPIPKSYE